MKDYPDWDTLEGRARQCCAVLERAGMGKEGKANTLLGMVEEACRELAAAKKEVTAWQEKDTTKFHEDFKYITDENAKLRAELDAAQQRIADLEKQRDWHKNAYLSEWQENEALLEKAGIDFAPDETGGKPIATGIEELITELEALRARIKELDPYGRGVVKTSEDF